MKQIIGIILIILAFVVGYIGFEKLQDSKNGIKIGEVEISSTNKDSQRGGYVLLGSSALLLIVGVLVMSRKSAKS